MPFQLFALCFFVFPNTPEGICEPGLSMEKGRPIAFEDDSLIPEDKRMAYKILRNAGCVPPEIEMKKEVHGLMHLIAALEDPSEKEKMIKELNFKLLKFNLSMKRPLNLADFPEYEGKLADRLLKK